MPEGHVIHRLASIFQADFAGHGVSVSSPQGRFAEEAARLDGSTLTGAEAVGKHLFIDFDVPDPHRIHIHLGLIGKLGFTPVTDPVGQVRLRIVSGGQAADLRGPQWCRLVTDEQYEKVFADSGPDPLRTDADPSRGLARIQRSGKSIAALLMDQRVAAGVGNIFRAEVLFRHGIDPMTPGRDIDEATWPSPSNAAASTPSPQSMVPRPRTGPREWTPTAARSTCTGVPDSHAWCVARR